MQGKFITLEGIDASGKTTNMRLIKDFIESFGFRVLLTREPGGTPLAEKIRHLILSDKMVPKCELLLFAAARAQHIEEVIKPALADGVVVVSDRFADSTYAYQGYARGYIDEVLELERFVLKGFEPDYTLFFDVALDESARRLQTRNGEINHFDAQTREFKLALYRGYQKRYAMHKHRMARIDANEDMEGVARQVKEWLRHTFMQGLIDEKNFVNPDFQLSKF